VRRGLKLCLATKTAHAQRRRIEDRRLWSRNPIDRDTAASGRKASVVVAGRVFAFYE